MHKRPRGESGENLDEQSILLWGNAIYSAHSLSSIVDRHPDLLSGLSLHTLFTLKPSICFPISLMPDLPSWLS